MLKLENLFELKVLVGKDKDGKSSVGFISNSHLQSYQSNDLLSIYFNDSLA